MKIEHQIYEMDRQRAAISKLYDAAVSRGKMRRSEREESLARIDAAIKTLRWVADNRDTILAEIRKEKK